MRRRFARVSLGIDSIPEKLNDLAAKFCSEKLGLSTLVQRLKIKRVSPL